MSLLIQEGVEGAVSIDVCVGGDAHPHGPAQRMARYLLAAARYPMDFARDLPPVTSSELVMLSRGRLVRHPIR